MTQERIKLRIGNREIFVTAEDAALLDSDLILLGNYYIELDWITMIGRRIDPATVIRSAPPAVSRYQV